MKIFNAFQMTAAFAAWPFLVSWLLDAEFRGASVAFTCACILYVVAFAAMVSSVYDSFNSIDS